MRLGDENGYRSVYVGGPSVDPFFDFRYLAGKVDNSIQVAVFLLRETDHEIQFYPAPIIFKGLVGAFLKRFDRDILIDDLAHLLASDFGRERKSGMPAGCELKRKPAGHLLYPERRK